MNIKSLFFSVVIFFLFSVNSQAQNFKSAIEYNDYLSSTNDTLYALGSKWGTKFGEVKEKREFEKLIPITKELKKFIARKKMEIFLMQDHNGSEKFRLAMVEFLFFQDYMVGQVFIPFESLSKTVSDSVLEKYLEKLSTLAEGEGEMLQKVVKEQKDYAAKNGFRIDE